MNALRILIPTIVFACVVVLGVFIAGEIRSRSSTPLVSDRAADPGLAALEPGLAGVQIEIPDRAGLHVLHSGRLLVLNANPQAERAVEVDLCTQMSGARNAPTRLFPLVLGATAEHLASAKWIERSGLRTPLRQPVVLTADEAAGFPGLVLEGDLGKNGEPPLLSLRPIDEAKQDWGVFPDIKNPGATRVPVAAQTWVLWRARGNGAFGRALALRHVPGSTPCRHTGTTPGVLRITLLKAADQPVGHEQRTEVVHHAGNGTLIATRLRPGPHAVGREPRVEDHHLFETAHARGLIRLTQDSRIEVAPRDLIRQQQLGVDTTWTQVDGKDRDVKRLLDRLYQKADGRIVRRTIEDFNQGRAWSALRVRASNAIDQMALSDSRAWHAQVDGVPVSLAEGMPETTLRLFQQLPTSWSNWLRVAHWPMSINHTQPQLAVFSLRRKAFARLRKRLIEVMTIEPLLAVSGGQILESRAACHTPACPNGWLITVSHILVDRDAPSLDLTLAPSTTFNAIQPLASTSLPIAIDAGSLRWTPALSTPRRTAGPQPISILAADGRALFAKNAPTPLAAELGLLPLVGLTPSHEESVSGQLRRAERSVAQLTIEPRIQGVAQRVLDCVAQRNGSWDARSASCLPNEEPEAVPAGRKAGFIVLDANSGGIVAAASTPSLDADANATEALAFHRFNPSASPLAFHPWKHDGGSGLAAGSSFKMVSALALEHRAERGSELEHVLAGLPSSRIEALGAGRFSLTRACFPECSGNKPRITNFRSHAPERYIADGRFGLIQALTHSVNTWFAWQVEGIERSLQWPATSPVALPLPIGSALNKVRPLAAVTHRLGFDAPTRLDQNLLPTDDDSILAATPSRLDPIRNRHEVLQASIGLRSQVTPLQMAQVAAAIATSQLVRPHVLSSVDGMHGPKPARDEPLRIRVERIRAGMHGVVQAGTARAAFHRSEARRRAAPRVYGKTGTAPSGERNTAWFVGWISPGVLPDEPRTLAFAVRISETGLTGGAHAAEAVAALIETLIGETAPIAIKQ